MLRIACYADHPMGISDPQSVIVLDYGAGNLRSVVRAVERVGFRAEVTSSPGRLAAARVVVLPGVGAAADTMRNLKRCGLVEPLKEYLATNHPFLGVCMGLEVLMTVSQEGGEHRCLDALPGQVVRLPAGQKVPHMGWNAVRFSQPSVALAGIPQGAYFYFVHSYYCVVEEAQCVVATTDYGVTIPAVVERGNLVATQFHPEKSGVYGLRLYRNVLTRAFLVGSASESGGGGARCK